MIEPRTPDRTVSLSAGPLAHPAAADVGAPADDEPRTLRLALAGAAVFHALVFFLPMPDAAAVAAEPEARKLVVLTQTPRFEPPEVPPEPVIPRREVRRVPVPDLTPHDPEPIRPLDTVDVAFDPAEIAYVVEIPPPPPEDPPEVMEIGGGVTRPIALESPPPVYPELARRVRREAVVLLKGILDREGRVTELAVVQGAPFGLTEAALDAVGRWRYEPATYRGQAVAVYLTVRVDFDLH
jgi:protein TonB